MFSVSEDASSVRDGKWYFAFLSLVSNCLETFLSRLTYHYFMLFVSTHNGWKLFFNLYTKLIIILLTNLIITVYIWQRLKTMCSAKNMQNIHYTLSLDVMWRTLKIEFTYLPRFWKVHLCWCSLSTIMSI